MASESPRRGLSRTVLVRAGLKVLDEHGVDGLTMRAVAARLGTGPASLYRHVRSRNELLDLLVDDAVAGVPLPDRALPWREQLRQLAHGVRAGLMAHRDLARVAMTSTTVSAPTMRLAEAILAALSAAGCEPSLASILLDRLSLYVTADALAAALAAAQPGRAPDEQHWSEMAGIYAHLDSSEYPLLLAHADVIAAADAEERFAAGLDLMLDGIATALAGHGG